MGGRVIFMATDAGNQKQVETGGKLGADGCGEQGSESAHVDRRSSKDSDGSVARVVEGLPSKGRDAGSWRSAAAPWRNHGPLGNPNVRPAALCTLSCAHRSRAGDVKGQP